MNKNKNYSTTILVTLTFVLGWAFSAQAQNTDCKDKVLVFEEFAKTNAFDDSTYEPWLELKKKCAKSEELLYGIGENILKLKIYKANASEAKNEIITELVNLYDEHDKNFPNNKKGNKLNKAVLLYENKVGSEDEIYSFLNKAFNTEYSQFTSAYALNLFSELVINQHKAGDKGVSAEMALEKLDKIAEKVQIELKTIAAASTPLLEKSKTQILSTSEKNELDSLKQSQDQLTLTAENIEGRIASIATCETLIPHYEKEFEANKENVLWLERASDRLGLNKCKTNLYTEIALKFHALSPSSKSAYTLGLVFRNAKNLKLSTEYFSEAAELQLDPIKKADYFYTLAGTFGYTNKIKARESILKALEFNPKMGKAYIFMAQLYANSVNDCGSDAFENKAVYWLAAAAARKAGEVEPKLKKSADDLSKDFTKRAPTKTDLTTAKRKSGQTIVYQCWINESLTIPKL